MIASGAMLKYLYETQKNDLGNLSEIHPYSTGKYMIIDSSTRRNLELVETLREKQKRGSLLWVLDKTKTAMGARTLRKYIEQPLIDKNAIEKRLDAVDELMKNGYVYEDKKENYFNFSNDKDEPTLRLDVSYDKNNKIIQYVSKEYGFTDSITSTLEKDPIEIIKHAQDILMNQQLPLTEVILPSHYSGGNYKAYIDDSYQYVIQTDINMLVRIEKREENDIVEKEVTSNIYSYDDITSAINTVIDYFNENFKGCTLKEIYYAGDNENYFKEILQQYGADEAIVLTSTFDVDGSGGDGSLNPNSTYKDWIWLLVRNKQGEWKHVDHGY